jgi:hypothetical protein
MKASFASISLVLAFCLWPPAAFGQRERANIPPERKPIDWFYQDANYHSKTLLLKVVQFTAPYPGYYQELSLDSNGNAFTGRIVPDWAIQGSENAKLENVLLNQIRRTLAHLNLPSASPVLEPQTGQVHTAFVFYDGNAYLRFNFNGTIPAQVDAILEIIRKELVSAAKVRLEQFVAHHKLMEETYGDWQNRIGVTLVSGGQMHGCKGNVALLLTLAGQRKPAPTGAPTAVSIYHALVFYPGGSVTGSGGGGNWSDDPVSSQVVIWTLPSKTGSFSENASQRKLEITHNAIEATVTIEGKTYQLNHGNMFIIRMDDNWNPIVTQLNVKYEEHTTQQTMLGRFKSIFRNDPSIQQLELY